MTDFVFSEMVPDFTHVPVRGIIFTNDPHLDEAGPGSRVDNYWKTITSKIDKVVQNVCENRLLWAIPGDVFYKSRVPPAVVNYLISKCHEVKDATGLPPLVIAGNHDMRGTSLSTADCLWTVKVSRAALVLSETNLFGRFAVEASNGEMVSVYLGGTPYGLPIPSSVAFDGVRDADSLCLWMTHHNLDFSTRKKNEDLVSSMEIDGVDEVFNGHIHHASPSIKRGQTLYHNLGSMTRTKLDEKERLPIVGFWVPEYGEKHGVVQSHELKTPEIESAFSQRSGQSGALQSVKIGQNAQIRSFVNFLANSSKDEIDVDEQIELLVKKGELTKGCGKILFDLSSKAKQSALK